MNINFCRSVNNTCVGALRRTSFMNSTLIQQCPASLVRLTLMVRWGGVSGCTAAILWSAVTRICSEQPTVSFCSSHLVFFSMHCTKVQVVQPHNNTDTATAWRNLCFIFSERSYFHMVNNPSIAVDVFPMHMMTSLLVDELLLPVM